MAKKKIQNKVQLKLKKIRSIVKFSQASPSAKKWWQTFEAQQIEQPELINRVAEELESREASLNDFFEAYVVSECNNIQSNLYYLDFLSSLSTEEREHIFAVVSLGRLFRNHLSAVLESPEIKKLKISKKLGSAAQISNLRDKMIEKGMVVGYDDSEMLASALKYYSSFNSLL